NSGRSYLYYEYCNFKGHTKDQCYKLHGYPRRKGGESHSNGATTGGIHSTEAGGKDVETMKNVAATSTSGTITVLMSDVVNHNWIVDTYAPNHMVHNLSLLNQHQDLSDQGDKIVNDVLFIPEFKYNLLSVSQLTKQLRCVVLFFPNLCIFEDLFSGNVLGICKENQGLYMLQTTLNLQQKVPIASNSLAFLVLSILFLRFPLHDPFKT
ncbi:hypothetical protein H5410_046959, partial [Solanum commersonii]